MEKENNQATDRQSIIADYLAGMGIVAVAKKRGLSRVSVARITKEAGVVRPTKRVKDDDRQSIVTQFVSGLTHNELAEKYGVSRHTIAKIISDSKIKRVLPYEDLVSAYKSGLSSYEVAVRFNVSDVTVQKYVNKAGCMRVSECKKARNEQIASEYANGLTILQVSKKLSIDRNVVRRVADRAGVLRRNIRIDERLNHTIRALLGDGKTVPQVSTELGVDQTIVSRVKFFISKPPRMGEKSPRWKGGRTALSRSIRALDEYACWRKSILKRDRFICQHCGCKHSTKNPLEVDHIEPFSLLLTRHNIDSLLSALNCPELWDRNNGRVLCKSCHEKTDTYLGRAAKYIDK